MKSNKTLILTNSDGYYLEEENTIAPLEYLPFFNKINILIGTNNSGKSKFMRKLMSQQSYTILNEHLFSLINQKISDRNRHVNYDNRVNYLKKDSNVKAVASAITREYWFTTVVNNSQQIAKDIVKEINNVSIHYIPTMRTAHTLYMKTKEEKNILGVGKSRSIYEKIEDDIFLDTLRKIMD